MVDFFALTTRGLEEICAQELTQISNLYVKNVSYRRVSAVYKGALAGPLIIRSADDLFIYLATWPKLPTQRVGLSDIKSNAAKLSLDSAIDTIAQIRNIPSKPSYSVTASFVGKRNYNSNEIKQAVSEGVSHQSGWLYNPDDRSSDLNIRIFIEHDSAVVGIRLHRHPLQKRSYKLGHVLGSLKPPIAASMVLMANPPNNAKILDPFCGAGTILIEADRLGYKAIGGDIDLSTLQIAQENASAAEIQLSLIHWDALKLPLEDNSIPTVITNIPWGKQIDPRMNIRSLHQSFVKEVERILNQAGKAVILTNHPEMIQPAFLTVQNQLEISLFGQKPTILVLSME